MSSQAGIRTSHGLDTLPQANLSTAQFALHQALTTVASAFRTAAGIEFTGAVPLYSTPIGSTGVSRAMQPTHATPAAAPGIPVPVPVPIPPTTAEGGNGERSPHRIAFRLTPPVVEGYARLVAFVEGVLVQETRHTALQAYAAPSVVEQFRTSILTELGDPTTLQTAIDTMLRRAAATDARTQAQQERRRKSKGESYSARKRTSGYSDGGPEEWMRRGRRGAHRSVPSCTAGDVCSNLLDNFCGGAVRHVTPSPPLPRANMYVGLLTGSAFTGAAKNPSMRWVLWSRDLPFVSHTHSMMLLPGTFSHAMVQAQIAESSCTAALPTVNPELCREPWIPPRHVAGSDC
jgi:hypothetical protein